MKVRGRLHHEIINIPWHHLLLIYNDDTHSSHSDAHSPYLCPVKINIAFDSALLLLSLVWPRKEEAFLEIIKNMEVSNSCFT